MGQAGICQLVEVMERRRECFRDAIIARVRADVAPLRLAPLLDDLGPGLDRLLPAVFEALSTGTGLDGEALAALRALAEGWARDGVSLRTLASVAVSAGEGARVATEQLAEQLPDGSHPAVRISFGQGVRVAQEATTALTTGHARGAFSRRFGTARGGEAHDVAPGATPSPRVPTPSGADLGAPAGDVLVLVAQGRTNGEIAAALHMSRQAVNYHVGRLMRRVGAVNRTALVSHAYLAGLLPPLA